MSRLAKKPLPIPQGVTCNLSGNTLSIQGGKGKIDFIVPSTVNVDVQEKALVLSSAVSE